ncbi:hypothetical protein AAG607_09080 [Citromicrobium bathyomarinum]|jgi:hypothetical protein|uniref:hypothetical protein n=1 Tax=Sphingomonadales TaxID=204457 RepID=UPI000C50014B|nr:hypothetical protein [Citromicrobium sp.]|tara:strand:+ start:417 stop:1271 length:855 start_codon:yes stop_codon:yes gene_type:complete
MRILIAPIALLAACSPMAGDEHAVSPAHPEDERSYATQVEAPTPDYAELMRAEHYDGEGYVRREATAAPPANARDIGRTWTGRLEAAHALLGAGYDGKGADGAVTSIDVGMTESEFARWAQENGWTVPRHIAWSFVPAMNLPTVSEAAKPGIRFWPASSARTGAQNEALLFGRVELRDGCFWATQGDGEADQLAFFHAEIGLDKDAEGFYVLKDRVGGQTLARLGEPMNWGGPPSAYIAPETTAALREACGDAPVLVVGSPESRERFAAKYPHVRDPAPPPPAD